MLKLTELFVSNTVIRQQKYKRFRTDFLIGANC